MTGWSRTRRSVVCGLLGVALVAAACGNGATARSEDAQGDGLSALTASFDAAVGPPQRYLVGLFTQDHGNIVDGSVSVSFRYLGSGSGSGAEDPQIGESEARFVATAGFEQRPQTSSPHVAGPDEGVGAYEVPEVSFDRAGIWEATVEAVIDGVTETTTDAFDVADQHSVPVAGDTSPTPTQPLAGDPTVRPAAIDSRASNSEPISDPELHSITVADAIASRRPTLVVVSTPTASRGSVDRSPTPSRRWPMSTGAERTSYTSRSGATSNPTSSTQRPASSSTAPVRETSRGSSSSTVREPLSKDGTTSRTPISSEMRSNDKSADGATGATDEAPG